MKRKERDPGIGEVHTHIGIGPHDESEHRTRERYDDTPFGMDDVNVRGEEGPGGMRGRAEALFTRARDRAANLGESGGLLDRVRDNPLPALGLALAVGFLLAGRTDPDSRFGRVKGRFRGTLVAGLTAALAEEAKEIFGEDDFPAELFGEKPRRRAKSAKRRRPRRRTGED